MRSLLSMRWDDLLFAHWPVDPEVVEPTLPDGLDVDTRDGDAYLGVVGFQMASIRPRGVPVGLSFPELNLRTYVRADDGPGVYFYNLDAADRVGVPIARTLFKLPYYRAEMRLDRAPDGDVTLRSRRRGDAPAARFAATYRPTGVEYEPEDGTLAAFLTENYRFYTGDGPIYYGDIGHPPWPLAPAAVDIESNTLFAANGFDSPPGDPLVHYSPGVEVTAERIRRVG